MNGPPRKTKHSRPEVHHVGLIELRPFAVRIQDDIAGLHLTPAVHLKPLVEAIEVCVLRIVGHVGA